MGLFIGDSEPSKVFIGDTEASEIYVGDTKVRPSIKINTLFDNDVNLNTGNSGFANYSVPISLTYNKIDITVSCNDASSSQTSYVTIYNSSATSVLYRYTLPTSSGGENTYSITLDTIQNVQVWIEYHAKSLRSHRYGHLKIDNIDG